MKGDFYYDLKTGKQGEKMVDKALRQLGNKVKDVSDVIGYRSIDIDFLVENKSGVPTTLEVKNQEAAATYGNVIIEDWNPANKSHHYKGWYYYCEAEHLAFVVPAHKVAHIVEFQELKDNLNNIKIGYANMKDGSGGWRVPVEELAKFSSYYALAL